MLCVLQLNYKTIQRHFPPTLHRFNIINDSGRRLRAGRMDAETVYTLPCAASHLSKNRAQQYDNYMAI